VRALNSLNNGAQEVMMMITTFMNKGKPNTRGGGTRLPSRSLPVGGKKERPGDDLLSQDRGTSTLCDIRTAFVLLGVTECRKGDSDMQSW
jgi:hypothetical protein